MEQRELGRGGPQVSSIGLGCLGMSGGYGTAAAADCAATVRRAVELGITLFDTADFYGDGANETLLARALGPDRARVLVATRGGVRSDRPGGPPTVVDGRPDTLRAALEASLRRLGTERVDLYYLARVDPQVPVEESVGALADLVAAGRIGRIGLSEATPEQLRRAHAVHPVAALETEYSLWERHVEAEILPTARSLGITLVAHTPLGKGMLTGRLESVRDLGERDHRRNHPRFADGNFEANRHLVEQAAALAEQAGATPAQLALAWLLSRGEDVVPIPGTKRIPYLEQNAAATALRIDPAVTDALTALFAPARIHGERTPAHRRAAPAPREAIA
ncbi:aldo/keto reductase [Kitasatospora sp. NPDC088134]|uniref:aldo/keto reductase n=1 Tax=Kitasatospora sp. NPDC088134 TaxID=3364071 RepID=UPI003818FF5F